MDLYQHSFIGAATSVFFLSLHVSETEEDTSWKFCTSVVGHNDVIYVKHEANPRWRPLLIWPGMNHGRTDENKLLLFWNSALTDVWNLSLSSDMECACLWLACVCMLSACVGAHSGPDRNDHTHLDHRHHHLVSNGNAAASGRHSFSSCVCVGGGVVRFGWRT